MDTVTSPRAPRTLDSRPVAPVLFAHFVLRSSNMQPMVDWYSAVLNMHVVERNDYICFLTYDEEHHRLGIVNIAGLHAPDAKSWGLAHVAYTFRNIGELLGTWRRLKKMGIEPYRPIHHGPTFHTDAFRKNPIGVAFDPDELARAYEAGVPEADLLRQPDGPAAAPQPLAPKG